MANNTAVTVIASIVTACIGFAGGQYWAEKDFNYTREPVAEQLEAMEIDSPTLPLANSPVVGKNALATVVVFTDFKTKASAQVYNEYLKEIKAIHGDKVAYAYKAFPLKQNPDSLMRAKVAAAAHIQGKFWEMSDLLFAQQGDKTTLDENAAGQLAQQIPNMNVSKFMEDLKSDKVAKMVKDDIDLGTSLGVKHAPAVFVNGNLIKLKTKGKIAKEDILSAVNADIQRMEFVTSSPAGNYYLGSLMHQQQADETAMTDPMGRPVRGAKNPLVTIVEYSDYQCPFCSRVEPTIAQILKEYPDTVRIAFNHNPLPFHKDAKLAHQAAYAAGLQGKFWEMHDILFGNQKNIKEPDLIKYAKKLDLDMNQFMKDLKDPKTVAAIDKALKDAEENGISGTPNFLINGEKITGAQPIDKFKEVIDRQLKNARAVQSKTGLSGDRLYEEIMKSAPKAKPTKPNRPAPAPEGKVFVEIGNSPVFGDVNAPITLVEFTDFECPFCNRGDKTVHELIANNPGKIKLVFKNNPLPFHKHADAAHRAAMAAKKQGKFWEMYHKLFDNQKQLEMEDIQKYAQEIGLDVQKLLADMESEEIKKAITDDMELGKKVGVRGTPLFFMNGTRINGAQPIQKFQETLTSELQIADKYLKQGVPTANLYKTIVEKEPKPAAPAQAAPAAPKAPIVMNQGKSYAKGPDNAPVVIYQFSEFQCPFCGRAEPTVEQIRQTYGDKVKIVFKNFPLPFHNNAQLASEAALAAGAQGKFWEMHEILFKNQKELGQDKLIAYAQQLGLDMTKFQNDLNSHVFEQQVKDEKAEGEKAGITGTPSFVINGKLVVGAQPFDAFKKEIDAALAK